MKNKQKEFYLAANLNFIDRVEANSLDEAIEKLIDKYIYGKGQLPREYIRFEEYKGFICQMED